MKQLVGLCSTQGTNGRKQDPIKFFQQGIQSSGDKVAKKNSESDFAVIFGVGQKKSPRKRVADQFLTDNKPIILTDLNPFSFSKKNIFHEKWIRLSLNNTFEDLTVDYCRNSNDVRWKRIQKEMKVELKPWRETGKHILLCTNNFAGFMMNGNASESEEIFIKIIKKLKEHTDRKIIIRPHPARKTTIKKIKTLFDNDNQIQFSNPHNIPLSEDIKNAWAAVFYNSGTSFYSILNGIPTFVTDKFQPYTAPVSNSDLKNIENPLMPEREHWIHKFCYRVWHLDEIKSGEAYLYLKPKILNLIENS